MTCHVSTSMVFIAAILLSPLILLVIAAVSNTLFFTSIDLIFTIQKPFSFFQTAKIKLAKICPVKRKKDQVYIYRVRQKKVDP